MSEPDPGLVAEDQENGIEPDASAIAGPEHEEAEDESIAGPEHEEAEDESESFDSGVAEDSEVGKG